MKRILLINFGRMGDILQTAPLITFLKERYPGSVIGLMGAAHFREVIEGIPDVDALHVVPLESLMLPLKEGSLSVHYKIFQDFLKSITGYDYDTVFNLTHNRLGAVLSSLLPGEKIGLTLDEEGFAAVKNPWMRHFQNASINRGFNQFNLVDLYKLSAGFKSGQLTKDNSRLRYNVSEKARAEADKLLQSSGVKDSEILIGFQPGASAEAKRWPAEYWNELGKALSERYRIIIFGSPKESELAQEAAEGIANAINLAGKTTIPLLAALLQKCSLLISNDTGTQHLASAVGTRVLSLALGPALASETGPYGEGHLLLEPSIDCAPCNYQHPCSDFACHRLITPVLMEKIADALIRDDRIESIIQAADRVIVSRTCFDEGGLWEMKRLNPGGNEIRRRVNTAYRKTWLEMANDCNETSYDDDINGRGFALELDEAVSSVRSLIELAERGEREAEKLMRLADCQPLDIDAVKAAGGALAEIDSDIAAIGYKQDSARPLTLDFHFGKEALPNGDLKSMAEKTAGLYSNLRKASTLFLKYLGEKSPLTPLFQTEYLNNCYGRRGVYPPAKFAGGQAPGLPAHERRGKGIKILAVDYPYLVTGSILKALADKAAEFRTVRLTPDMMADPSQAERFIYQLLDTAGGFRPDFLFTVNHFGFDSEGFLIGELEKLGIKSAVYYVDSPDYVMPDPEKLKSLSQALFVWDNYYVEILRGQGFDNVHYLPLASDPEVFNPRRRNDSVNLR
ncbi:MAG: hypothetical protein H8E87_01730, partial [FCB group bacterium]|nr:hypothetical protein [FCB group bacterium]